MAKASPIVDVSSTTTATIYPYALYKVPGRQSRIVVAVRGLYDALYIHYNLTYQNIHTLDTKNCKRRHLKELMPQIAQCTIHMILKNTQIVYLVIKIVNKTSINQYNAKLYFIFLIKNRYISVLCPDYESYTLKWQHTMYLYTSWLLCCTGFSLWVCICWVLEFIILVLIYVILSNLYIVLAADHPKQPNNN